MKNTTKKLFAVFLVIALCMAAFAGCGGNGDPQEDMSGAASKVLLVVSFGTSYNDNRELSIGAVEKALEQAYGDEYEIRRAFTSQIIIDKLASRDGIVIDNVTEAMDRLVADGVKEVVVQPTHIMSGYEFDDVVAEVTPYADKFDSLKIGKTLLRTDEDFETVTSVLAEETAQYAADDTAVVFMGHGTEHSANVTYARLQEAFDDGGYDNYFIGTVEAEPTVDDVLELVKEAGVSKVVLLPFMIVAGDHANNDMAGGEEDSWNTIFENEGYEVECVIKGVGQYEGIRNLIVKHAGETINEGAPLYANQIENGEYHIEVSSSSSMFRVVDAVLNVKDEEMSAVLTLSGTGYEKLYMGTGEEAAADTDDKCIYFVEDAEGMYTYEVPVEALNTEIDCAAWSIRKQEWYDRVLVFLSGGIPQDAISK